MNQFTFTITIPSANRPTLRRTLESIAIQEIMPGDEILVIGDGPGPEAKAIWDSFQLPGRYWEVPKTCGDWGHSIRNQVVHEAKGEYHVVGCDDDIFLPQAFHDIRSALYQNPGKPHMFRIWLHRVHGYTMPAYQHIDHVGATLFVYPNDPSKIGHWPPVYHGDKVFIQETLDRYPPNSCVWRDEYISIWRPDEGEPRL